VQVQKLLKLLEQPTTLLPKDILLLETLIKEYPYFYLAHALLAKMAYAHEHDVEQYAVQRAATYATDRSHLRSWLENKLVPLGITSSSRAKPVQEEYLLTNNYLELIAKKSLKKSTNEKSMEQFSVIDTILNKNLQFDPFLEAFPLKEGGTVDLSESRTTLDDRFATATLANIMVKQKKYKRAIEIYERLMLKYPEKKSYFADIITSLNNDL
jgi:hypothetical protein